MIYKQRKKQIDSRQTHNDITFTHCFIIPYNLEDNMTNNQFFPPKLKFKFPSSIRTRSILAGIQISIRTTKKIYFYII